MTAPGWYNAEGDPVGTQRYWDGVQWVGDAVYEPAAQAAAAGVPAAPGGYAPNPSGGYGYDGAPVGRAAFPSTLKTVAIVVSVLKAIPLVFLLIGAMLIGGLEDDFEEFGGVDFDGVFGAIVAVFLVIFAIGAVLLFFQLRGAIKERPMMLFVAAVIMAVLDILSTLAGWAGWNDARDNPFESSPVIGPIIITLVMIAQVWIAVQAIRTHNAR